LHEASAGPSPAKRSISFARDHEYSARLGAHDNGEHAKQEVDVLLVRDAADMNQHRLSRRDAELRAEALPVAAREAVHLHAGRDDVHRALHTIVEQRLLHCTRGHDERVENIALGNGEAARDESHDRARHQRHVVMQVLFEVRVISLDDRNT
jgi:hypothetical protein